MSNLNEAQRKLWVERALQAGYSKEYLAKTADLTCVLMSHIWNNPLPMAAKVDMLAGVMALMTSSISTHDSSDMFLLQKTMFATLMLREENRATLIP